MKKINFYKICSSFCYASSLEKLTLMMGFGTGSIISGFSNSVHALMTVNFPVKKMLAQEEADDRIITEYFIWSFSRTHALSHEIRFRIFFQEYFIILLLQYNKM